MQESIADSLTKKPDELIQFQGGVGAESLLLEIGVLDKFSEVPQQPGLAGGFANAVGYSDHATHWIIGFLYCGYEDDCDNGYCVSCFPKKKFSSEQVMNLVRAELSRGGSLQGEKTISNRSPQN